MEATNGNGKGVVIVKRVVREESGVSKSSRHGAKRRDSLTYMIFDRKLTELEIVVVKFSE